MDKESRSTSNVFKLPFMPKSNTFLICQDKLRVNWFEGDFCQSRYSLDKSTNGSNSCTIITVLIASYCNKYNIPMYGPTKAINPCLIRTVGKAMLDGNSIHACVKKKGILTDDYLSIPEAIKFGDKSVKGIREWKSVVCMKPLIDTLDTNLKTHLDEWRNSSHRKRHPDLYAVLICDFRSVVFIIDSNSDTITLVDTHQHTASKGAVIAVVNRKHMKCLCTYLCYINSKYYNSVPTLYELSFIYFRRKS